MAHEIGEERPPHLLESGLARLGDDLYPFACRSVAVMQFVIPRQHRVAVDLPVDTQTLHQFDPAIENGVVVRPRAVGVLRPDDHIGIGVVTLIVPRILVERRRNDLLSGVGQKFHHRFQRLEVSVAPYRHPFDARHGGGMLPQVEVITPLGGCGERTARNLHLQIERLFAAVADDRHRRAVAARRSISRHVDRNPYGTHRAGVERHLRTLVEHVGREHRSKVFGLPRTAAAGEFVAHHIPHETRAGRAVGQFSGVGD